MEIWKKIKGYDYEVSSTGNVRTLGTKQKYVDGRVIGKPIKILKPNKPNNGYLNVFLYHNKSKKGYGIHRLVAEAFIPNPDNLPQVNHIDGNKTNNNVENLEWCDASYNQLHAIDKGLKKVKRINQYDLDGNFIKTWDSIKEITNFYNKSHVTYIRCCNGKQKTTYGYIWKYKEEMQ